MQWSAYIAKLRKNYSGQRRPNERHDWPGFILVQKCTRSKNKESRPKSTLQHHIVEFRARSTVASLNGTSSNGFQASGSLSRSPAKSYVLYL